MRHICLWMQRGGHRDCIKITNGCVFSCSTLAALLAFSVNAEHGEQMRKAEQRSKWGVQLNNVEFIDGLYCEL